MGNQPLEYVIPVSSGEEGNLITAAVRPKDNLEFRMESWPDMAGLRFCSVAQGESTLQIWASLSP